MTRERDLLVRAIDSQPAVTLDFDAIEAAGQRAKRRRSRRSVVGAAVVVAGVALGGAVVMTRPSVPEVTPGSPPVTIEPLTREIAYCYRSADITSTEPNQHIPVGISNGDAAAAIMEICTDIWSSNLYQWSTSGRRTAPALVACVLNDTAAQAETGAAGVFPGDSSTCSAMGLPVADL